MLEVSVLARALDAGGLGDFWGRAQDESSERDGSGKYSKCIPWRGSCVQGWSYQVMYRNIKEDKRNMQIQE